MASTCRIFHLILAEAWITVFFIRPSSAAVYFPRYVSVSGLINQAPKKIVGMLSPLSTYLVGEGLDTVDYAGGYRGIVHLCHPLRRPFQVLPTFASSFHQISQLQHCYFFSFNAELPVGATAFLLTAPRWNVLCQAWPMKASVNQETIFLEVPPPRSTWLLGGNMVLQLTSHYTDLSNQSNYPCYKMFYLILRAFLPCSGAITNHCWH